MYVACTPVSTDSISQHCYYQKYLQEANLTHTSSTATTKHCHFSVTQYTVVIVDFVMSMTLQMCL